MSDNRNDYSKNCTYIRLSPAGQLLQVDEEEAPALFEQVPDTNTIAINIFHWLIVSFVIIDIYHLNTQINILSPLEIKVYDIIYDKEQGRMSKCP